MAPAPTDRSGSDSDINIGLEELVFSCTICQATPSEVYATSESTQGFHSGSGGGGEGEDGIVTKMWIAECSHITCAKHLENGAAPFHPAGMQPRAPCPKCARDKGDSEPKDLYSIRGLGDGEYDPMIPSEWRQCPAIKLDASIPGMSAVRFQYIALGHYARQARKHWKTAESKRRQSEIACDDEHKRSHSLQKEVRQLEERARELEKFEVQCQKWEARKPEIQHYLQAVPEMSKAIESMRTQLYSLGVHVQESHYSFRPETPRHREQDHHLIERYQLQSKYADQTSSRKRKREDYTAQDPDLANIQKTPFRRSSREIMPPPPPKSSPFRPTQRNTSAFQNIHSNQRQSLSDPSFQVCESNPWQPVPDAMHLDPPETGYSVIPNHTPSREKSSRQPYASPGTPLIRPDQGTYSLRAQYEHHAHTPSHHFGSRQQHLRQDSGGVPDHPPNTIAQQSPFYQFAPPVATASPQKIVGGLQTSATSPFSKHADFQSRPSTFQCPPTRGNIMRRHDAPIKRGSTSYIKTVSSDERPQTLTLHAVTTGPTFIEQSQPHANHQSVHRSSLRGVIHDDRYSHPGFIIPQTPRNSQGLLQRPDTFLSATTYTTGRPHSSVYGGPLTQLPQFNDSVMYPGRTTQKPGIAPRTIIRPGNADEALSQVPGVKGLRAPPTAPTYSQPGSSYGAVRGLFSSAGGRRRVRR